MARCPKACPAEMPKSTKPSLRASGVGSSGAAEVEPVSKSEKAGSSSLVSKCEKTRSAYGANRSSVLLRHECLGPRLVSARKLRPAPEVGDFCHPLVCSLYRHCPCVGSGPSAFSE